MITEDRATGLSSKPSSFVNTLYDGHVGLTHKSYLKHEIDASH